MAETNETNSTLEAPFLTPADPGEAQQLEKDTATRSKVPTKLYIILGILIAAVVLAYFAVGFYFQRAFLPGTTVNDVDVSGLTPAKALELLNADAAGYSLTLLEADDATEQILGSDIGLSTDSENFLTDIVANQNFWAWAFQSSQEKSFSLDMNYDSEKLSAVIDALSCMDKKTWCAPKDAYITYEKGTGYQIVPDVVGTVILPDKFLAAVEAALSCLDDTLSLEEAGVYKLPEISSEDVSLL